NQRNPVLGCQAYEPVGRELALRLLARPRDPEVPGVRAAPAHRRAFRIAQVPDERILGAGVKLILFDVDGFRTGVAAAGSGRDRVLDVRDITAARFELRRRNELTLDAGEILVMQQHDDVFDIAGRRRSGELDAEYIVRVHAL